jgi:predicted lactoylglutathione lyase
VTFVVSEREIVNAFHKAALAAGGRDNGAPGFRKEYHPNYYGAFIIDPDGNSIEVVFGVGSS